MTSYLQSKQLYYFLLRVPKDEAYFVYFTLESNEGLAFFSTVDDSLKGQYRDIDVKGPVELRDTVLELLKRLQTEIRLDILEDKIIQDA